MRLLLLASICAPAFAGLILNPVSAVNHNGFELHAPGVVPNLPHLWTYRPIGTPAPDFDTCGQIGFIGTLEDGTPDPDANPAFLQINSSCPKSLGEALLLGGDYNPADVDQRGDNNPVPEPGTGLMAAAALIVIGVLFFATRSKV